MSRAEVEGETLGAVRREVVAVQEPRELAGDGGPAFGVVGSVGVEARGVAVFRINCGRRDGVALGGGNGHVVELQLLETAQDGNVALVLQEKQIKVDHQEGKQVLENTEVSHVLRAEDVGLEDDGGVVDRHAGGILVEGQLLELVKEVNEEVVF